MWCCIIFLRITNGLFLWMSSQVLLISRLDISAVFSRKRWGLHFWNIRMNTDFLLSIKIWSIRKTPCMWSWNAMDSPIISCFDGCSRSTSGAHLRRCGRICGNNSTFSYTIQSSRKYEGKYRSNHCHGYVKTDLGCSEICFLCEDNHIKNDPISA